MPMSEPYVPLFLLLAELAYIMQFGPQKELLLTDLCITDHFLHIICYSFNVLICSFDEVLLHFFANNRLINQLAFCLIAFTFSFHNNICAILPILSNQSILCQQFRFNYEQFDTTFLIEDSKHSLLMLLSKLITRNKFLLNYINNNPSLSFLQSTQSKQHKQIINCLSSNTLNSYLKKSQTIKFGRSNKTHNALNNRIKFHFATIGQLKQYSTILNSIDSIIVDRICQCFQQRQGQDPPQLIIKQIAKIYQSQSKTQSSHQDATKIYLAIKKVYQACSKSEVGFLRGDIYSNSFHRIYKYTSDIIDKHKVNKQSILKLQPKSQYKSQIQVSNSQLSKQDYRNILNLITDPRVFRLPEKGVHNAALQVKKNLLERQLILEEVSTDQAFQKFYTVLDSLKKMEKVHMLEVVKKHVVQWFTPVCKAIKDQQLKCNLNQQRQGLQGAKIAILNQTKQYQDYLVNLNAQKIASLAISELMKLIMTVMFDENSNIDTDKDNLNIHEFTSIRWRRLCTNIQKAINGQFVYQRQQKKFKECQKIYDKIRAEWAQRKLRDDKKMGNPQNNQSLSEYENQYKEIQALNLDYPYVKMQNRKNYLKQIANKVVRNSKNQIPEATLIKIATLLIYIMRQTIKVRNKYGFRVPLLVQQITYFKNKKTNSVNTLKILKIDQFFISNFLPELQRQGDLNLHLDRSLPTLTEPLPWLNYQIGGYYLQSTSVMRFAQCNLQSRLVKYADLSRVYSVLNYLSSIPWKINKKVLKVIEGIWQQGGCLGQVPKRYSQMMNTYIMKLKHQKEYKKQKQYMLKIQKLRDQHSLRSDFLLKLNIARSYSKLDRFYFPHNLDFRGRVYPIPPHLNHIGNDLARGLLLFATGQKLGQSGLKWLKIHCANLMGKDKAVISQKLLFIQQNIQHIKLMAQNPLKYRQWLEYEDCWQAISAIIQLNDALNHPNPYEFVSNLHVHQDGSCNGLQHYAALGRDIQGAYQVNLGPTQRPGDVYTHVAKMVVKFIQQDVNDPKSPEHEMAKQLTDNIKRKTIKQTVMTSVYGVTFIGARQQIYKQLRNQNFMQEDQTYKASIYVAKLTLRAISNLFQGAHLIKKWFLSCARMIAQTNNPIGWITPMGLPVVQPYRKTSSLDTVNTITQTFTANINSQNLPINKLKQQSAFPPNFVHSLDSTHMMYTAEKCRQKGLTFAAVHDSYWTHAGNVQKMNEILRQQFVRLHSQPLLENLKTSFQRRFPQINFPTIPKRGQFDLQKVKQSVYFFS